MQPQTPVLRANDDDLGSLEIRFKNLIRPRRQRIFWHSNRVTRKDLVDGVQLLAGLEAHCLSRWDIDLGPGAGIAPDASLAWPHVEYTKATQFDAFTFG